MRRWCVAFLIVFCACVPGIGEPESLRLVRQRPLHADSIEMLQELVLVSGKGDTIDAVMRRPVAAPPDEGWAAIVLLAGRGTGREAAAVIPGRLGGIVLAVEYPAAIPEQAEVAHLLRDLPEIRRSAYAVPGVLRGAAALLARQSHVDAERIGLVGVSFGVPFAAAAAPDPIFCCVALHHGGADLGSLFRANLPVENRLLRSALAAFGARYFRQLEPARHVGSISPRPLLLINALYDELVPPRSAERLAGAAGEPMRHIWLPHEHLMPHDTQAMRELADSTLSHFPQLAR